MLSRTGAFAFEAPREISGQPSEAVFTAIETLQREQGLKLDGRMDPGGETLSALNVVLRRPTEEDEGEGEGDGSGGVGSKDRGDEGGDGGSNEDEDEPDSLPKECQELAKFVERLRGIKNEILEKIVTVQQDITATDKRISLLEKELSQGMAQLASATFEDVLAIIKVFLRKGRAAALREAARRGVKILKDVADLVFMHNELIERENLKTELKELRIKMEELQKQLTHIRETLDAAIERLKKCREENE